MKNILHEVEVRFQRNPNPFSTNVVPLHLLETLENRKFSDVFKGNRIGALVENGLNSNLNFLIITFDLVKTKHEF